MINHLYMKTASFLRTVLLMLIVLTTVEAQTEEGFYDTGWDLEKIPYRKGECWGYADPSGKIVVEPVFEEAGLLRLGRARVKQNGKFGYVNRFGNVVIEPVYETASEFTLNEAKVTMDGKTCLIDRQGIVKNEKPSFRCGGGVMIRHYFTTYRRGEKTGLLLKICSKDTVTGQSVRRYDTLPPIYDQLVENHRGIAAVRKGDRWGLIDKIGNMVLPLEYDTIAFRKPIADDGGANYFGKIRQGDCWGFIDKKGQIIALPQYESVEWFDFYVAWVKPFGQPGGYIDTSGREYFEN